MNLVHQRNSPKRFNEEVHPKGLLKNFVEEVHRKIHSKGSFKEFKKIIKKVHPKRFIQKSFVYFLKTREIFKFKAGRNAGGAALHFKTLKLSGKEERSSREFWFQGVNIVGGITVHNRS